MIGLKHILIVDDDRALRATLATALEACGMFHVTEVGSVADAKAKSNSRNLRFDAIMLDLGLPDGDGRDLCDHLRRDGVRVPIIMLTDAGGEHDVVRGLDAGANDYVIKPFRVAELTARLRAQIRGHETSEDVVLMIGPYHFMPSTRQLFDPARNRRIRLIDKEAGVLKYLYRAGDMPTGRQTLLREVWGYSPGASSHTVETHIYRLRRKIEASPSEVRILINEDGGYRLRHDLQPGVVLSSRPSVRLLEQCVASRGSRVGD
jgi:DNA-binding response OmpR family regulator